MRRLRVDPPPSASVAGMADIQVGFLEAAPFSGPGRKGRGDRRQHCALPFRSVLSRGAYVSQAGTRAKGAGGHHGARGLRWRERPVEPDKSSLPPTSCVALANVFTSLCSVPSSVKRA